MKRWPTTTSGGRPLPRRLRPRPAGGASGRPGRKPRLITAAEGCSTYTLGCDALPASDLRPPPRPRRRVRARVGGAGRPSPARTRLRGRRRVGHRGRRPLRLDHRSRGLRGRRRRIPRVVRARRVRPGPRASPRPQPDRDDLPAYRAVTCYGTSGTVASSSSFRARSPRPIRVRPASTLASSRSLSAR
jgi:hypothetical protein